MTEDYSLLVNKIGDSNFKKSFICSIFLVLFTKKCCEFQKDDWKDHRLLNYTSLGLIKLNHTSVYVLYFIGFKAHTFYGPNTQFVNNNTTSRKTLDVTLFQTSFTSFSSKNPVLGFFKVELLVQ